MKSVLTLICNPAEPILTIPFVSSRIQDAFKKARPRDSVGLSLKKLAENVAIDIEILAGPADAETVGAVVLPLVREAFANDPVDIAWGPAAGREK
ncbi:MAG: hypothetical protein AAGL49_01170 [Pseudomonadota bacterium]